MSNTLAPKREHTRMDVAVLRFVLTRLKEYVHVVGIEEFSTQEIVTEKQLYQAGTAENPIYHYYLIEVRNVLLSVSTVKVVLRVRVITEKDDIPLYVDGYFCSTTSERQILMMNLSKAEFIKVL